MPAPAPITFHWTETTEQVEHSWLALDCGVDRRKQCFESERQRLYTPLVVPIPERCMTPAEYAEQLPAELTRQCVILMQAGAISLGLFEAGQALHTKTMKKYVVRGTGRAQPTQLKTRGKSRYGSRLRLQNARHLLEEAAERLSDWWREEGPIEQVYLNAPERLWADFLAMELPEALRDKNSILRIPLDLPRPTTDVLLRTYRAMEYGRILPRD